MTPAQSTCSPAASRTIPPSIALNLRTPSGKVDFSGVCGKPVVPDAEPGRQGTKGPSGPARSRHGASTEWNTYDAANGDYTGACLPFGMTRSMNTPEPMQFMQSDKYLSFLFEQNSWFPVVPIDGRPHRDGIATWFGDSVGHWEGDTLVVDTVNFNGKTRLDTVGHPHSDQLHLTQRFSRPDFGHIAYEVIVDDPKTFTKPWRNVRTLTLSRYREMIDAPARRTTRASSEAGSKVQKYKLVQVRSPPARFAPRR